MKFRELLPSVLVSLILGILAFFPSQSISQPLDSTILKQFTDSSVYFFEAESFDRSIEFGQKALNILQQSIGEHNSFGGKANRLIGSSYYRKGLYQKALPYLISSLKIEKGLPSPQDSIIVVSYDRLGQVYCELGQFNQAIEHHRKAIKICRLTRSNEKNLSEILFYNFYHLGYAYDLQSTFDSALVYYNKALSGFLEHYGETHKGIPDCYTGIGIVYDFTGQLDKAITYYHKALELIIDQNGENHIRAYNVYNNLGIVYRAKGNLNKAITYHQKALRGRINSYPPTHPYIAASYNNLAVIYKEKGELVKALEHNRKALEIRKLAFGGNHYRVAGSYGNIGSIFVGMADLPEAIRNYKQSVKIISISLGKSHLRVASEYANLGLAYRLQQRFDSALFYNKLALNIYRGKYGPNHHRVGHQYHAIGIAYKDSGDFDQALKYLDKALKIKKEAWGELHSEVASTQKSIGLIYLEQKNFEKAEAYLNSVLDIRKQIFGYSHPKTADIYDILSSLALEEGDFETAIAYSDSAIDILGSMRKEYTFSESKQIQVADNFSVYEQAILNVIVANKALPDKYPLEKVFTYMEKAKSNVLLEALHTVQAVSFSNIPDSLLQQEYDLKVDIAYYEKKRFEELQSESDQQDSLLNLYNQKLIELRETYEILLKRLEQKFPAYYQMKYSTEVSSLQQVRKNLQDEQALLEYFVGEKNIYLFFATVDSIALYPIPLDFPLKDWIQNMRKGLYQYHLQPRAKAEDYIAYNDTFSTAAYQLYQKLIDPVKSNLPKKLIVIPDGILGYIPFEALLKEKPGFPNAFTSHSYLIWDHQISYTYSATLLEEIRAKHRKNPSKQLLVLAPSFGNEPSTFANKENQRNFGALKYNIPEGESIKDLIGGEIFSGLEATKRNFLKQADQYRIIHLSTHGKANDAVGDYSFLAFAQGEDSTAEDKLYVRELYNLNLNAELVVLSACETGVGELKRGEGIISLARGFTFAGASSIVTSLWSVDDANTKNLMEDFYRHLKSGKSKDEALWQAKIDHLNKSTNPGAHPFYWAAFIPIGDMTPLKMNFPLWASILITIIFLMTTFILLKKAIQKNVKKTRSRDHF